mmetsp:Transcript_3057/g.2918  ORF Transcript_3057/g.2918 Transcript_3057/m.2918 type:complete len:155 (+) Transcript_3057:64-528(+)
MESIHDFIVICSDGVFDKLSNDEIVSLIWQGSQEKKANGGLLNVNEACGVGVDKVMKEAMIQESLDNVSVVMIAFKNFAAHIESLQYKSAPHQQENKSPNILEDQRGKKVYSRGEHQGQREASTGLQFGRIEGKSFQTVASNILNSNNNVYRKF